MTGPQASASKVTLGPQQQIANGLQIAKRQAELGLLPKANATMFFRETQALQARIIPRARQQYILPRLLEPTQVSFFEPVRLFRKESGDVRDPQLDMSMIARLEDEAEFEEFMTKLPGFTFKYSVSWREGGIARNAGRPIEEATSRAGISRMLRAANKANIEGAKHNVIEGLTNQVSAETTMSVATAWDDAGAKPYYDLQQAMGLVADLDLEIDAWRLAVNTRDWVETAFRTSNTNQDEADQSIISRMPNLEIVPTTAVPRGTALGIPRSAEFATLYTTGLPQVVPVRADAEHAEWVIRMIAVEQVFEEQALFKLTGLYTA